MAHEHKFAVERILYKDGVVTALDMRCDCGMPLWCDSPQTHAGDSPNRLPKFSEFQREAQSQAVPEKSDTDSK